MSFVLVGLPRHTFLRIWPNADPISCACACAIAVLSTSAWLWRSHRRAPGCHAIRAPGLERRVAAPPVDVIPGLRHPAQGWRPRRDPSSDGLHRGGLQSPVHHTPSPRHCTTTSLVGCRAVGLRSRTIGSLSRRCIVDTREDEVVATPSQAAALALITRTSLPVSPPLQAVALPMLLVCFVTLALGSCLCQLPQAHGHHH